MQIKSFNGLNNTTETLRAGVEWLATADNVNITDTGALVKREGYSESKAGTFTGGYSTIDYQRFYLVDGLVLKTFDGAAIGSVLVPDTMYWTELNDQVFFSNGIDAGIIMPDNEVLIWRWSAPNAPTVNVTAGNLPAGTYRLLCTTTLADGRETGASDTVLVEIAEGQALQIVASGNVYIAPANSTVFQYAGRDSFIWNRSPDFLGRDYLMDVFDPAARHRVDPGVARAHLCCDVHARDQPDRHLVL